MFGKLFGGKESPKLTAYELGADLFQQGMKAASEYRTADAIGLYTRSIETNPNAAPFINRAKLYRWRLLFADAINDLEIAMRLDMQQGDQFAMPLGQELRECKILAENRFNGKMDLFQTDLKKKGFAYVATRIVNSIFDGDGQLLGYHLVNEVDNIKKFENIDHFPSIKLLVNNWMTDQSVIDETLSEKIFSDPYKEKRNIFEAMICVYEYRDMATLRDEIVRQIWCLLNPASQMQPLWEVSLRRTFC